MSVAVLAAFTAYSILCITLPGTLIRRALRGGAGLLPVDAALGTAVGLAVELPVYLLCRALGVPLAVLAWPVATVLAFAAVPRLRRFWRGSGRRLPRGVLATAGGALTFTMLTASMGVFRWNALDEPAASGMHVDLPFQIALVGLLKHDVPLDTPWVAGTGLDYHWFVHAHGAAASWITGAEPQVLVMRLLPVPLIAAFLLAVPALVHRITGRWWPGNVAVTMTLIGAVTVPTAWTGRPLDAGVITDNLWVSPTQTYAALLFVVLMTVLLDLFRGAGGRGSWVLFVALTGALAGAKATFLPMLLCGLVVALLVRLVRREPPGPELPALLVTGGWLGFAQIVLFGTGSQGTEIHPLQTVKFAPLGWAVLGRQGPPDDWPALLVLTGVALLAVMFGWAGMVGLLRWEFRADPIVHVMLGFAAAGVGGMHLLAHPGLSQTYFGRSATPYLAMLSAIGLSALLPAGRRPPRLFTGLVVAGVVAVTAALIGVRATAGHDPPASRYFAWTLGEAVRPYLVLAAAVGGIALLVVLAARAGGLDRDRILAAGAIVVAATALASGVIGTRPVVTGLLSADPMRERVLPGGPRAMPPGAITAARWLRDHSDPHDRVATNSHCRLGAGPCDSRDFWLAAFAERQVVLEGWSYTEPAFASGGLYGRTLYRSVFWEPELLAANDEVFHAPTAERVDAFTREHDVRWLVAVGNTTIPDPGRRGLRAADPGLGRFADQRFRAGDVTVYQVRPTSGPT
ncbi:hypothetical protein [Actinoplanes sp. NBRC 101535]|uniref:hypothetical protein n=1 Tax=Actinoplanes sp. NBRC 101535 TaxID=3032196 RepID=UPI0024A469C1|nr:hypothetical protein [Actinoplanes sp. NBRC 101535]GLY04664.1 hypothetical protein Acsp01_50430 [Actinoplanes sp. NBRC 101535]